MASGKASPKKRFKRSRVKASQSPKRGAKKRPAPKRPAPKRPAPKTTPKRPAPKATTPKRPAPKRPAPKVAPKTAPKATPKPLTNEQRKDWWQRYRNHQLSFDDLEHIPPIIRHFEVARTRHVSPRRVDFVRVEVNAPPGGWQGEDVPEIEFPTREELSDYLSALAEKHDLDPQDLWRMYFGYTPNR